MKQHTPTAALRVVKRQAPDFPWPAPGSYEEGALRALYADHHTAQRETAQRIASTVRPSPEQAAALMRKIQPTHCAFCPAPAPALSPTLRCPKCKARHSPRHGTPFKGSPLPDEDCVRIMALAQAFRAKHNGQPLFPRAAAPLGIPAATLARLLPRVVSWLAELAERTTATPTSG